MTSELLKDSDIKALKEFVEDMLDELEEEMPKVYKKVVIDLHKKLYGCCFSEILLEKALSNLSNNDNTKGKHYSLEQTNDLAKSYSITFDTFNQYDWCYVLNMIYSDYYGIIQNDTSMYVKLARAFLQDKDAPSGKALKYYLAMCEE